MIASWPPAYPDESLYSIIARSGKHRRVNYHRSLVSQLFGFRHARAQMDMPIRLHFLSTKIPGQYNDEPERIAHELTMLRLHLPFVRRQLGEKLVRAMIAAPGESVRSPSLHTVRSARPKSLRFCPRCWEEQRQTTELHECYWSRSHQAAGYVVCAVHEEPMWESPVTLSYRPSLQQFFDASAIDLKACRPLPVKPTPVFLGLARSIWWLINENDYFPGAEVLQGAYIEALRDAGFYQGLTLRMKDVRAQVARTVSADELVFLESELREGGWDWLETMLRPSRLSCTSQPAFRHVLFMKAIGHTPATFFAAMQRPSLLEETLGLTTDAKPVEPKQDWSDQIRGWWADREISVNEMSRRLRIDPQTVNLAAARQGLPLPRFGQWGNRMAVGKDDLSDVRQRRRAKFLELCRRAPEAGLKVLGARDSRVVTWLRRHDWQWLQDNRPVRQRRGGAAGLDWAQRDSLVAKRLPAVVGKLRISGQRVTVSAIERELGIRISNMRKKLPQTDLLLTEVCQRGGPLGK